MNFLKNEPSIPITISQRKLKGVGRDVADSKQCTIQKNTEDMVSGPKNTF